MSQEFIPGQRYVLTVADAMTVLRQGSIVHGTPDLTRGRLFIEAPGKWAFWMLDGTRIDFSVNATPGGCLIVSQSREPDRERPEPLTVG